MYGENKCIINLSTVRDLCSLSLSVHRETDWQEQQTYAELPRVRLGWWITECSGWWDAWFEPRLHSPEGIWCRKVAGGGVSLSCTTVFFRCLQEDLFNIFSFFLLLLFLGIASLRQWSAFLKDFGRQLMPGTQHPRGREMECGGCWLQCLVGDTRSNEEVWMKGTSHPSLSSLGCAEPPVPLCTQQLPIVAQQYSCCDSALLLYQLLPKGLALHL